VNIVQELNAIPVSQVCTEQMIDTSRDSPYTRLTMNIFTAFAEFEREIITERSRDGYEKPIAEGKRNGRPNQTGLTEQLVFEALRERSLEDAARILKVLKSSLRDNVWKMGGLPKIRQRQDFKNRDVL
jgi:DNA invertase Pin-like site-specific DNA recombinase